MEGEEAGMAALLARVQAAETEAHAAQSALALEATRGQAGLGDLVDQLQEAISERQKTLQVNTDPALRS